MLATRDVVYRFPDDSELIRIPRAEWEDYGDLLGNCLARKRYREYADELTRKQGSTPAVALSLQTRYGKTLLTMGLSVFLAKNEVQVAIEPAQGELNAGRDGELFRAVNKFFRAAGLTHWTGECKPGLKGKCERGKPPFKFEWGDDSYNEKTGLHRCPKCGCDVRQHSQTAKLTPEDKRKFSRVLGKAMTQAAAERDFKEDSGQGARPLTSLLQALRSLLRASLRVERSFARRNQAVLVENGLAISRYDFGRRRWVSLR